MISSIVLVKILIDLCSAPSPPRTSSGKDNLCGVTAEFGMVFRPPRSFMVGLLGTDDDEAQDAGYQN